VTSGSESPLRRYKVRLARRAVSSLVELQRPDQQRIRAAIDRVQLVQVGWSGLAIGVRSTADQARIRSLRVAVLVLLHSGDSGMIPIIIC
jgi:hypothetical protein